MSKDLAAVKVWLTDVEKKMDEQHRSIENKLDEQHRITCSVGAESLSAAEAALAKCTRLEANYASLDTADLRAKLDDLAGACQEQRGHAHADRCEATPPAGTNDAWYYEVFADATSDADHETEPACGTKPNPVAFPSKEKFYERIHLPPLPRIGTARAWLYDLGVAMSAASGFSDMHEVKWVNEIPTKHEAQLGFGKSNRMRMFDI